MTKITNIPDDHHIVRHCKGRLAIREDGVVKGVFPELFHLRPPTEEREQETYLSALYFEYFKTNDEERYAECREALSFKPKPRDAMARLNVGKIKAEGKKKNKTLRVTHEPKLRCMAYAAIRGVPYEADDELAAALAQVALMEAIEVSNIK